MLWEYQDFMSHFKGQLAETSEGNAHGLAV